MNDTRTATEGDETMADIDEVLARNGLTENIAASFRNILDAEGWPETAPDRRRVLETVARLLDDADVEEIHARIASPDGSGDLADQMRADARAILAKVLR